MPPTTPAAPRVPSDEATSGSDPDSPLPTGAAQSDHSPRVTLRRPSLEDGAHMWRLARDSGGLDLNTSYAYLLFARDFAQTCQVAVVDGEVSAFMLGYLRPTEPDTLFVWQVAVDPRRRGHGLAARMLDALSDSLDVRHVEATITADNTASQRLFTGFARRRGVELTRAEMFAADDFPDGQDAEGLVRIGPLRPTGH